MAVIPLANYLKNGRIVVPIGSIVISNDFSSVLTTYGVGTSMVFAIWDKEKKSGAFMHAILPNSQLSPEKAVEKPGSFVDSGMDSALQLMTGIGSQAADLRYFIGGAGGLKTGATGSMDIGAKNLESAQTFLAKNNITNFLQDVGGIDSRTIQFNLHNGTIDIKTSNGSKIINLL